jgi:hypothetical protein
MGTCDRPSRKPRAVTILASEPYTDTEGRPPAAVGKGALAGHEHTTNRIVIHAHERPQFGMTAFTFRPGARATTLEQ